MPLSLSQYYHIFYSWMIHALALSHSIICHLFSPLSNLLKSSISTIISRQKLWTNRGITINQCILYSSIFHPPVSLVHLLSKLIAQGVKNYKKPLKFLTFQIYSWGRKKEGRSERGSFFFVLKKIFTHSFDEV